MPDWEIFDTNDIIPIGKGQYFHIVDELKDKQKGWLYRYNPPPLKNEWKGKYKENIAAYQTLVRRFGVGAMLRPSTIQETLGVGKTKCGHVMQYLCSFGYVERYIAGVLMFYKGSRERKTYGVHYMLLDKKV